MATQEPTRPRAPRGTRSVTLAFFAALDELSADRQAPVAAAALAAIQDALKARRLKAREAAARARAKVGALASGGARAATRNAPGKAARRPAKR